MNKRTNFAAAFAFATLFTGAAYADGTVNIYTYRQPELIQPVLDAFTAETGIKTEVLFLDKGLEERVAAEGQNSPVDVIMTVDIARLTKAKEAGITQALNDETINTLLPAEYRDPEGHWFGLTKRARVVYASKDRVTDTAITYADLADPKWKGKICMRSGQHDYNLALISAAVAHWGPEKTEQWLTGLKANLGRKPDGGDRPQAGAIVAGECDLAIGNTYYVGLMRTNEKDPKEKEWGNAINVIFPTFENGLTHVNISGIALAKNSAEPRQCREAHPVPGEPQGAADLRREELRVSDRAGPRTLGDGQVVRRVEGRHSAACRHRLAPQAGFGDGGSGGPRRRPVKLSNNQLRANAGHRVSSS